ncbi:MAG: hypothetical protein ACYC0X_12220 [Pirellulaceae bacterium]
MKPNQDNKVPKAIRASLKAIWRGLNRCLYRHPSIYHDMFEPQSPIEQAFPDIWKPVSRIIGGTSGVASNVPDIGGINQSFRKANDNYDLPYEWKHWHEPNRARYFGCFYGDNGAAWNDFKRLGESAYLVLREIQPELPDDSLHGWMLLLHQLARQHPTALLRSHDSEWKSWECHLDEDHKRWVKPEQGVPYPQHPIQWTLKHDVVTSSMAAIELVVDNERALLISEEAREPAISFLKSGTGAKDDRTSNSRLHEIITKPRWNPVRRELWVGDSLIKRYRQPAPNQEPVLAAFEEEGWPQRIDDPLSPNWDIDPKRRLRDTVAGLNSSHKTKDLIVFEPDGTGEGVLWELQSSHYMSPSEGSFGGHRKKGQLSAPTVAEAH